MKNIIVVGAGGFGREVMQYLVDMYSFYEEQHYILKGFLDDNPNSLTAPYLGQNLIGNTYDYKIQENDRFIVAIGEPTINESLAKRLAERGGRFFTLRHHLSYIAETAYIGQGCILCPFSFVGPEAILGTNVILNIFSSVGHDAVVGNHCVLSPYATVNGNVVLDNNVFMGTHATVVLGKKVGAMAKLSAGAVVMHDIPSKYLVHGNPAKGRQFY